ncbi:hydroxyisourate hydrolase [Chryseobacterium sp. HSC-36S06]|uniref:hydroxyisourate hydrolase n=1 Tax=Chryseobacterium sp. HSC-36S06 TaxID=2910970 RepID=UPI00346290A9
MSALLLLLSVLTFAQKKKHQLSSHILDVSKGVPAAGVTIRLEKYSEQTKEWTFAVKKLRHLKFRSLR